jgi:hypothetical protein
MVGCVAGFAAAIAVAAMTGTVTVVHLLAMGVAYLSATLFVANLVADGERVAVGSRRDHGANRR